MHLGADVKLLPARLVGAIKHVSLDIRLHLFLHGALVVSSASRPPDREWPDGTLRGWDDLCGQFVAKIEALALRLSLPLASVSANILIVSGERGSNHPEADHRRFDASACGWCIRIVQALGRFLRARRCARITCGHTPVWLSRGTHVPVVDLAGPGLVWYGTADGEEVTVVPTLLPPRYDKPDGEAATQ